MAAALRTDGSLDPERARDGSFDGAGWALRLGPGGAPRFVRASGAAVPDRAAPPPATVAGDANWDDRFGLAGVDLDHFTLPREINAIAVFRSDVYVAGTFDEVAGIAAGSVARWDGRRWHPLAPLTDDDGDAATVHALAVSEDGSRLYAGGDFTLAGDDPTTPDVVDGIPVNGVASWNGRTWSALGAGTPGVGGMFGAGVVRALAVLGGRVYAGGAFLTAGDATASGLAHFDGTEWHGTGGGVQASSSGSAGTVHALTVSGGQLYVGGAFTFVNGSTLRNRIAVWDGTDWTGETFNGGVQIRSCTGPGCPTAAVRAITVVPGAATPATVFAGGTFDSAGGTSANSVAKWDGTAWSALGSGVDGSSSATFGTVRAIAFHRGVLYAGGDDFTRAGGLPVNRIAKWATDPGTGTSTWSRVGQGTSGGVHVLVSGSSGELFVGGAFREATGTAGPAVPVRYIANWTGTGWRALGLGVSRDGFISSADVQRIAVDRLGNVYVAGRIRTAGSLTAINGIARWDGSGWSLLGTLATNGVEGMHDPSNCCSVRSMAAVGDSLYVGGAFARVGGVSARNIARYDRLTNRWSPLSETVDSLPGEGTSHPVDAIAVAGRYVYVSGPLSQAGVTRVGSIARYDTVASRWSAVGGIIAIDNVVRRMIWYGGRYLLIGGDFLNLNLPGGTRIRAPRLLRWDSLGSGASAWSVPGGGVSGRVLGMAVSGSDLFVGGLFTRVRENTAPLPASNVARLSLATDAWDALGGGTQPGAISLHEVNAVAAIGSDVYIGGSFGRAGSTGANHIARWSTRLRSWSALGNGVCRAACDSTSDITRVADLALGPTGLFVGGSFTTAGDRASPHFARWGAGPVNSVVRNGGFETGSTTPAEWTLSGSVMRVTAPRRTGSAAARLSSPDSTVAAQAVLAQAFPVTPGTLYTLSAWTRVPVATRGFRLDVELQWRRSDGSPMGTVLVRRLTAPTGGWDQAFRSLVAPGGAATARVSFTLSGSAGGGSANPDAFVDDVTFGTGGAGKPAG